MADDLHALFAPIGRLAREVAVLVYVDAGRRPLGLRHIPGATDWLQVPIRPIVRDLLAFGAHGVVIAHNHPSGDAVASRADLAFTRRLALCLDALDVTLHDHLILSRDRITSLRAEGYL